jgi:hypothetical protein
MNPSFYTVPIAIAVVFGVVMPAWKAYSRKRNQRQGPPMAQVDVPAGQGSVTVRRPYAGFVGAARSFTMEVDGVVKGKVKSGKAVAVALPQGMHSVQVRMGRIRSDYLTFQITEGAAIVYETELVNGSFSAKMDLRKV